MDRRGDNPLPWPTRFLRETPGNAGAPVGGSVPRGGLARGMQLSYSVVDPPDNCWDRQGAVEVPPQSSAVTCGRLFPPILLSRSDPPNPVARAPLPPGVPFFFSGERGLTPPLAVAPILPCPARGSIRRRTR